MRMLLKKNLVNQVFAQTNRTGVYKNTKKIPHLNTQWWDKNRVGKYVL